MTTAVTPQPQVPDPNPPVTTTPVDEDIDARELREAEEAAKAEETASPTPGETPAPGATPAAQPAAAAPAPADQPMIPKPRFDEAVAKAKEEAAYWKGLAEGRQQPGAAPAPGAQPAAAAPTIEERRATIRTQRQALAKKFDDGEITMADLEVQRDKLTDQEDAIREEALLAKVKPAAAPAAANDDLALDRATGELEEAHPWVGIFDQVATPSEWGFLKSRAIENLTARGVDPTKGNIGKYELRAEMAALSGEIGPALLASRATAKGITLPGQQQPAPGQPPAAQPAKPLSEAASARSAKLAMAAGAPPNLAAMSGVTGSAPGQVSEAAIENMTEDEIGNLPKAVQDKLLAQAG